MSEENNENQEAVPAQEPQAPEQAAGQQLPEQPAEQQAVPAQPAAKKSLKERVSAAIASKPKAVKIAAIGLVVVVVLAGAAMFMLGGGEEPQPSAQGGNVPPEMEQPAQAGAAPEQTKPPAQTAQAPGKDAEKPVEKKPELTPEQKAAAEAFRKAVEDCLADSDWVVRRDAVAAIGYLGFKDFVPELNRMTRDRNASVRSEASKALLRVRYANR